MVFTGKVYDFLKYIAQIVLPALGTFYFSLAGLWHFPNPDAVVGTIMAADTFLGVILLISSSAWEKKGKFDGELNVVETEGRKLISLDLEGDPDELDQKSEVIFKVNKA